ncbi:11212_t:CDS:1 [Acaulospora morrowiae]|uniref:11212_t:CDS:1 n=1 Tax=Acaulospora morrowiae TaxID=94023 RepID=A0A9N8YR11_9GLOM|nr:11212_t:CDS:1 [Acaulospora morrowiae]
MAETTLPPRKLSRRNSTVPLSQAVYLGLEIDYNEETSKIDYAICAHDGSYTIDYNFSSIDVNIEAINDENREEKVNELQKAILDRIVAYSKSREYKILAVGIGAHIARVGGKERENVKNLLFRSPSLASKIWFELDAIPFIIGTKGDSVDERASSAVRKTVVW